MFIEIKPNKKKPVKTSIKPKYYWWCTGHNWLLLFTIISFINRFNEAKNRKTNPIILKYSNCQIRYINMDIIDIIYKIAIIISYSFISPPIYDLFIKRWISMNIVSAVESLILAVGMFIFPETVCTDNWYLFVKKYNTRGIAAGKNTK